MSRKNFREGCVRQMAKRREMTIALAGNPNVGKSTLFKDVYKRQVVDNFERGLGAVTEEQKEDSFVAGMEMIYKQIMTTLDSVGVKAIEAVGNEFDPDFHNAVTVSYTHLSNIQVIRSK